jgi:hypothetical protein
MLQVTRTGKILKESFFSTTLAPAVLASACVCRFHAPKNHRQPFVCIDGLPAPDSNVPVPS